MALIENLPLGSEYNVSTALSTANNANDIC